jgi:hypothetical protein
MRTWWYLNVTLRFMRRRDVLHSIRLRHSGLTP